MGTRLRIDYEEILPLPAAAVGDLFGNNIRP
jgi:hypothetical protein